MVMLDRRLGAILGAVVVTSCAALAGIDEGAFVPTGSVSDGGPSEDEGPSAEVLARLRVGLSGYWRFEGNGADSTDGGSDLTPTHPAAPQTYDAGRIGEGWVPGFATDDDCHGCNAFEQDAAASSLQIHPDFTVSVWVKPQSNRATDEWLEYGIFDNGQVRIVAQAFNVSPAPCHPAVFVMRNGTPINIVRDLIFDFRSSSNVDRWNHVVAFRKGTTLGLWINHNLTTTEATLGGEGAPGTFRIGGMAGGHGWQGVVDELALWSRALEQDEIDALYNRGRGSAFAE
jgi:hypothetical protein